MVGLSQGYAEEEKNIDYYNNKAIPHVSGYLNKERMAPPIIQKSTNSSSVTIKKSNLGHSERSQFWTQFWPNFWATFFGALIGFGLALLLDYLQQRRSKNIEAKERRKRHISVLKILLDEIERNKNRLSNMQSDLAAFNTKPNNILTIDYSVVFDVWRAICKEILDAIHETDLAKTVTELYDCLCLVASAFSEYKRIALDDVVVATSTNLPRVEALVSTTINLADRAATGLNAEIKHLENDK